jgi:hypothetical protein
MRQLRADGEYLEKHCKNVADALVEARRAADFEFRPDHNADRGCIVAPRLLKVSLLQSAASGVAMLLSPVAGATLESAVDTIVESARAECVKPLTAAKAQYDATLRAAQTAARTLEPPRDAMRRRAESTAARLNQLKSLPKGSNEFEAQRQAVTLYTGLRVGNCRTWLAR